MKSEELSFFARATFELLPEAMMKPLFAPMCRLVLLAAVLGASGASQAQVVRPASKSTEQLNYDVSQEVTLSGTVSSLVARPAQDMVAGAHLLLTTLSGDVDISLGSFSLRGKGALSVAAGQQIEATGVMKTFKGKQVFLARTVKVSGHDYAIRNEHGIPITPQARERAIENGETR
jgi:hypothetical protein